MQVLAHHHGLNKAWSWDKDFPQQVCFRITRKCNARCCFCLAPPTGAHPDEATLVHRIDWLMARRVSIFQFCGGEPTIHPGLAHLVTHVHAHGGKVRLTTNGITIRDSLIRVLRFTGAEVKVSLHGDPSHHNKMVGVSSFERTKTNILRLVEAGVRTSVQTTVVAQAERTVDWMAEFCLETGIRRLSILPFLPRGNGAHVKDELGLSSHQRRSLHDHIKRKRHQLSGRVDVRWLDFAARPILVVDADGRVVFEAATEATDRVLGHIPEGIRQMR